MEFTTTRWQTNKDDKQTNKRNYKHVKSMRVAYVDLWWPVQDNECKKPIHQYSTRTTRIPWNFNARAFNRSDSFNSQSIMCVGMPFQFSRNDRRR